MTRRPDSQQLARQWALLRLLAESPKAYTIKELAEQLATSKTTIERDLATIQHDFALVEVGVGKQKKAYRIDDKIRALQHITFGAMELLAIYAAHGALASLAGTPVHEELHSVLTKIRGFLSPRHNGGLDALARVFAPHVRGHVDYEPQRQIIDDLVDAIARRRWCELTYHSTWQGTTRTHRARPLKLVSHRSALYVLACLGEHQRITTLAVHRVKELAVTKEEFQPPRVDVDAQIRKAFGIFASDDEADVEIIFDADIAWRIEERTFHPDERKERRLDGALVYRLRSSAQWEIVPWVQTFGSHAELVKPASWRTALRESAEAVLARYTGP
jgi:predicted DNA-binding transcriptional regulator YafY